MLNFTGERLKELRKARDLTQAELAGRAELSEQAVSHWEKNIRRPSLDAAQALAAALECTVIDLMQPCGSAVPPKAVPEPLQRVPGAINETVQAVA